MSNIKQVYIKAEVPKDWREQLPESERRQFEWDELVGIKLTEKQSRAARAYTVVTIQGEEAYNWQFLDRLASALASVGRVTHASARDVQFEVGEWNQLELDHERPQPCAECGAEVYKRPGREERDSTKFGFGKLWGWAYTHEGGCPIREAIHADKELEDAEPKIEFGPVKHIAPGVTEVAVTHVSKGGTK